MLPILSPLLYTYHPFRGALTTHTNLVSTSSFSSSITLSLSLSKMAFSSSSFLYFFSIFLSLHLTLSLSTAVLLPITKHPTTSHYLTRITHGSDPTQALTPASLLVDLNSPFLWLDDCSAGSISAVHSRSIQCTSVAPNPSPPSSSSTCSLLLQNPITGISSNGNLVDTAISLHSQITPIIDSFLLACAPAHLSTGLPSGSSGVFGLGKARISPVSQISHSFESPKRFSLCLSPTTGMVSFDDAESDSKSEVYKSMVYTPMLDTSYDSPAYTIPLKSIRIQNNKIETAEPISMIKISTVDQFTKMETALYKSFVEGFVKEAETLNMMRVPPMGGFELCYGVEGSRIVPVIDMVLQSEMVKWRIYGHNSMVKVNDQVICLGFLDGGDQLNKGEIVLGTHQFEDNLLEFDLGSSMVGFSSSLLKMQTSCDQLTLTALNSNKGGLRSSS